MRARHLLRRTVSVSVGRPSRRHRIGARRRTVRVAVAAAATVAALAAFGVARTEAYFTSSTQLVGQTGTVAVFGAVASTTATRASGGTSADLQWGDAAASSWRSSTPDAAITYTVQRNTRADFSVGSGATTVYEGPARTFSDADGGPALSTAEFSAVAGGVSSAAMFGVLGGRAYYWGAADGWFGATGLPTAIGGTADEIVQLAPGRDHLCALSASSRVFCVGRNDVGQLGNAITASTPTTAFGTPVAVSPLLASGERVVQVTAGEYFSCALGSAGTIACWGLNTWGQLGVTGSTANSAVPVKAAKAGARHDAFAEFPPVQIAAGAHHVCALKGPVARSGGAVAPPQQHTVACWGRNNAMQIGSDITSATAAQTDPSDVHDQDGLLLGVTSIRAAGSNTCVLNDRTGAMNVACWGDWMRGVLGDGISRSSHIPLAPTSTSANAAALAANPFTALTVGGDVACAARANGYACWGSDGEGQLGRGQIESALARPGPVGTIADFGSSAIVGIAASNRNVCARGAAGELACWGSGDFLTTAQNTSYADRTTPTIASLTPGTRALGHSAGGGTRVCTDGSALRPGGERCSLRPRTAYSYRVTYRVAGADNWVSEPSAAAVAALPDTTAPTPPVATVGARTGSSIAVSWTQSVDDTSLVGYRVHRAGALVTTLDPSVLTYTFTGLGDASNHQIRIDAVDGAGNVGTGSPVSATTRDTVAPSIAVRVASSQNSGYGMRLTWSAATDAVGVSKYRLHFDGRAMQELDAATTSTFVSGLNPNTAYGFRVEALDAAGNVGTTSTCQTTTENVTTGAVYAVKYVRGTSCAEVMSENTHLGAWIGTYGCYGNPHQRFRFDSAGDGAYTLVPMNATYRVAGIPPDGGAGHYIQLRAPGENRTKWYVETITGTSTVQLRLDGTSLCMDVNGASTNWGANIIAHPCNTAVAPNAAQQFVLER